MTLRSVTIGREALWGDEALTLMLAKLPAFDLMFRPVDPTPGLYYVVQQWLITDHPSNVTARLPAFIAGVLTIPAGYWLGKAALDRRAGLAVSALLAVSGALIDYSQEARAYSLLVLLVTVSAAGLIDAFPIADRATPQAVRWKRLAIFAVAGILAVYTHFVGWLWMLPAMLLAIVQVDRFDAASRKSIAIGAIAVCGLLLPELNRVAGYALSTSNEFHWLTQPDLETFFVILDSVLLPLPLSAAFQPLPDNLFSLLIVTRNVILIGWLYMAIVPNWSRLGAALRRRSVAASVILVLLSIPLSAWLIGFLFSPILMIRTALPAAPGFFLALVALARLKGGWRAILLLVLVYAGSSAASGLSRTKEPWAKVVRIVATPSAERPLVLFCPTWRAAAFLTAAEELHAGGPMIIVFKNGRARLISRDFGRDPDWTDRFVELAMKPALPAYRSAPPAGRLAILPSIPRKVVLVKSQCPATELAAMMSWLGGGEAQRVENATITVSIFRSTEQKPRLLVVDGQR